MNGYDERVFDAVRRTLDAVRRMRLQAALHARQELRERVDEVMAAEEALVGREVEALMGAADRQGPQA
jgi:hypothetical protein